MFYNLAGYCMKKAADCLAAFCYLPSIVANDGQHPVIFNSLSGSNTNYNRGIGQSEKKNILSDSNTHHNGSLSD